MNGPLALIAELTYRCPLKCVYCSNPVEMAGDELSLDDWAKVLEQARRLGMLQVNFTGGEPIAKAGVTELVRKARKLDLYSSLITSGVGLNEKLLDELASAGLDHVQLSFQDANEKDANRISGTRSHATKLACGKLLKSRKLAVTVNIVVHRQNLARLEELIALAEEMGAEKLELAHVQYYGWAMRNRAFLLPTREQVRASVEIVKAALERLAGKMRIDFVTPDYYARFPKACMGGWAQKMLLVNPYGVAMPCHSAGLIKELDFPNVRAHELKWIWESSPAFQRFRGEDWMREPCRTCERRTKDFGGCRCQAMMVLGDASATDPVCSLSPHRTKIDEAITADVPSSDPVPIYRQGPSVK